MTMLPSRPSRLRLVPRVIIFAAFVYAFFWVSGFPHSYDDDELPPSALESKAPTRPKIGADQLIVSVRTTAVDAYAKVPPLLLLTNDTYHYNLILMSDLHMDIGQFHIHDVLDRYDHKFVAGNADLDRYARQVHYVRNGMDLARLKEGDAQKEKDVAARLEKYKVLRMLQRAWENRPDRSWYAFVDVDTYLIRHNLLLSLSNFDPEKPIFFANPPTAEHSNPFASGGTTFILSKQAMRALLVESDNSLEDLESRIKKHSSAFEVLSSVLSSELGLDPGNTWPYMSGFDPATIPFGPGLWCEEVISMSSVSTKLMSELWRLERDRTDDNHYQPPLLFADLWIHFFLRENMGDVREDWDNLSAGQVYSKWNILFESTAHDAHRHEHGGESARAPRGEDNWQACSEACSKAPQCMQWSYSSTAEPNHNGNGHTKCHLSSSMKYGAHIGPHEIEIAGKKVQRTWKSGWRKERFVEWAKQQKCNEL